MAREEHAGLIQDWMPLIHHVIAANFNWAVTNTGTNSYQRMRRAISYEDLVQEGVIALIIADSTFDPERKVSFKTYAYSTIFNCLFRYIDRNYTPITTGRSGWIKKYGSPLLKRQLASATDYVTFSELVGTHEISSLSNQPPTGSAAETLQALPHEKQYIQDPGAELERMDFSKYCIRKLRDNLTVDEFQLVFDRANGATYHELGFKIGKSWVTARTYYLKVLEKCRHILKQEKKDNEEK